MYKTGRSVLKGYRRVLVFEVSYFTFYFKLIRTISKMEISSTTYIITLIFKRGNYSLVI